MKTKESILWNIPCELEEGRPTLGAIYEAMGVYAKEMSIGFGNWIKVSDYIVVESKELNKEAWVNCKENEVMLHGSDWHYTNLVNECGVTTEELYNIFLQSLKIK